MPTIGQCLRIELIKASSATILFLRPFANVVRSEIFLNPPFQRKNLCISAKIDARNVHIVFQYPTSVMLEAGFLLDFNFVVYESNAIKTKKACLR